MSVSAGHPGLTNLRARVRNISLFERNDASPQEELPRLDNARGTGSARLSVRLNYTAQDDEGNIDLAPCRHQRHEQFEDFPPVSVGVCTPPGA